MCAVLAAQQLVPSEHVLVSLLLKYRIEQSILGHQGHCLAVTGTISYNHLLKFAALKKQVGWFVPPGLTGCLPQNYTLLKLRNILILSPLLPSVYPFIPLCVLYTIHIYFATLTKSGFSVLSCKISFF